MLAIVSLYGNCIMPANFAGETAAKFFAQANWNRTVRVTSWTHGQSLTAKRNPYYWQ